MEPQRPQIAKVILRKKNKAGGGITIPDILQSYSNQYGSGTRETHRSMEQDSPEINPHLYGQLIYERRAIIYNSENTVSSINGAGNIGQLHVKE